MQRYLCGTPQEKCTGGLKTANHGLRDAVKIHVTRESAFKCHRRYLLDQGFVQVGTREFIVPPGQAGEGTVRVLNKKSKFGGELRPGKSDKTTRGKRFRPTKGAGLVY